MATKKVAAKDAESAAPDIERIHRHLYDVSPGYRAEVDAESAPQDEAGDDL